MAKCKLFIYSLWATFTTPVSFTKLFSSFTVLLSPEHIQVEIVEIEASIREFEILLE